MLIGVFNVVVSCSCSERGITCESCDVRLCCVRLKKRGGVGSGSRSGSLAEGRRRGRGRGEEEGEAEVGVRRLCGWWCEKREGERGGLSLGRAGAGWGVVLTGGQWWGQMTAGLLS